MQFALLIFESPEAFAARHGDENDPYLGAWRAYYKALVEADIYVGGNPLQPPETGTTVQPSFSPLRTTSSTSSGVIVRAPGSPGSRRKMQ